MCENSVLARNPCNALKPVWNDDLIDALKHDSIFLHNLWNSAGKPKSGVLFKIKKSVKFKYKLHSYTQCL